MIDDIRFALRMLAKSPGAALVAVLALGIGMGANVSMFISLRAMVLKPLPFPRLNEVVTVWESGGRERELVQRDAVSPANFLDWRERTHSFRELAAHRSMDLNLTGVSDPERLQGCAATPAFFRALEMRPQLGRTFSESEAQPGHDAVAVLSHGFWKRRFAGANDIVNRTVMLDGRPHIIVGVMPEDFDLPLSTDVWVPLAFTPAERADRAARSLEVIGRLAPGVSLRQAVDEMRSVATALAGEHPDANHGRSAVVLHILELTNQVTDRFVSVLMAAASFVLLLACVNVANIHLARSTGRMKETAIRTALGGTRWRIARQLLVESLLVSLAGGVLGVLLCGQSQDWMDSQIPRQVHKWVAGIKNLHLDGEVYLYAAAVAVLTGLLCGLGSAVHASSSAGLADRLKQGGRSSGAGRHGLRKVLVAAEVALAMILLTGAGLMVQTFRNISHANPGYDTSHLLMFQIALQPAQRPGPAEWRAFHNDLRRSLTAQPGVVSAGFESGVKMLEFTIEGRPANERSESVPWVKTASAGYFESLRLPVRAGRVIDERDGPDAQGVIVLSESVAHRYWKSSENPVGSRIRIGGPEAQPLTVIGVVADVKDWFLNRPFPLAYVSLAQHPARAIQVFMRTQGDPLAGAGLARAAVRSLDANQPIHELRTVEQQLADQMSGVRITAAYMAGFAGFALILAATGTYAVMSYMTSQRMSEMGVRMALGADRSQVLRMVMGQSMWLSGAGLAVGLAGAFGLARLMSSLLYGVVGLDWTVFAGIALLLSAAALLAGYIPARRAAGMDPTVALRAE